MNNKSNANITDLTSIGREFIVCLNCDPGSIANLAAMVADTAFTFYQRIPFMKLQKYLEGVRRTESDLEATCRLSSKLFSDPHKCIDNALRIIKYVTDTDTEKKIDYLVYAARAMLLGLISVPEMFRIYQAIDDTLPEDLEYLSEIVGKSETYKGNIQVQALERSGLMITSEVNPNVDIEEQEHIISTLGYLVDEYAVSFDNNDRQEWYKKHCVQYRRNIDLNLRTMSNQEIDNLLNDA